MTEKIGADFFFVCFKRKVDFDEVRNAMDTLLFSQSTKDTIWAVLAAVLHLGNVAFTDKRNPDVDEVAKVVNKDTLAFAAKLVGCDPKVRRREAAGPLQAAGCSSSGSVASGGVWGGMITLGPDVSVVDVLFSFFCWCGA